MGLPSQIPTSNMRVKRCSSVADIRIISVPLSLWHMSNCCTFFVTYKALLALFTVHVLKGCSDISWNILVHSINLVGQFIRCGNQERAFLTWVHHYQEQRCYCELLWHDLVPFPDHPMTNTGGTIPVNCVQFLIIYKTSHYHTHHVCTLGIADDHSNIYTTALGLLHWMQWITITVFAIMVSIKLRLERKLLSFTRPHAILKQLANEQEVNSTQRRQVGLQWANTFKHNA